MSDRTEENSSFVDPEVREIDTLDEEKEISLDVTPEATLNKEEGGFESLEPSRLKKENPSDPPNETNSAEANNNKTDFVSFDYPSTDSTKDDFNKFEDFSDDGFDDGFVNANNNDDDFGDFDDFEETNDFPQDFNTPNNNENEGPEKDQPSTPTEADIYVEALEKNPDEIPKFIEGYFNRLWSSTSTENTNASFMEKNENPKNILNTACSFDLWDKLSRDTVFHNPVTGAVGPFQWTRSEANKAYLNALGVTITSEEKKFSLTRTRSPHLAKKRQTINSDGKPLSTSPTASSPLSISPTQTHTRSASATDGLLSISSKAEEEKNETKEVDQDLELDIDIARAYCELTEETIRIFPDVKLNAMVTELTRLQKQAGEYLEHLLDQREQLLMDAETYNDLISCIVGQAQRLREQNPGKDSSPAMVSKKKKAGNSSFSSIMRRKTTSHNTQSVSMGGGVVGVQHPTPSPNTTLKKTTTSAAESRRSL
ncbi:hypothetical protein BY458DRAFT_522912 [Sporodiniella umbellata]|nr:hypothetical protein BY458DRAFT_522912 [Sporodiniella umbellata]